ncbi:type III-B CRISPR-associated protein Cas10/Cmr2 [Numidum massiliense]|uniref:type III-B CRISPR-associated protein Cas10/Cmr2 n=1 Tax=Numidum massiliense TaxID=1522315 RepID=UPI0006D58730|nr:type III-B CRISPR-associated protein Cas10/Cmr2 [Numidum massiliense]
MTATRQMAIFTIGPVQSFIASARKTEDLWSGSYVLSFLVERAIEALYAAGRNVEMIFPQVTKERIALDNKQNDANLNIASLPNRLTALIEGSPEEVAEVMGQTETIVRDAFKQFCSWAVKYVFPDREFQEALQSQAERQVDALLEVYWVLQPYVAETSFSEQQEELEVRLNALKSDKQFSQFTGAGITCSVCKERDALSMYAVNDSDRYGHMRKKLRDTWQQRSEEFHVPIEATVGENNDHARIKDNEFLCGVCLGKRVARDYFKKDYYKVSKPFASFPSTQDIGVKAQSYFAILKLDGDNMGKLFSGETLEQYRDVSRRLSHFAAKEVPKIVAKYEGVIVYAGGDDVLAFFPVDQVLDAANELRLAFGSDKQGVGREATASAGVVIGHKKAPLHHLLNEVRKLEGRAKEYKNRLTEKEKDALALAVHTHAGEIAETVVPWQSDGEETISQLKRMIDALEEELSTTFIYRFAQVFAPLVCSPDVPRIERKDMLEVEFGRLVRRSLKDGKTIADLDDFVKKAMRLHDVVPTTDDFFRLLKMLTFFQRKGVNRL